LFPVLMLTGAQLSQVFRNVTTNELSNAHRYQWLKDDDGRFANPFDRGCKSNTLRFCQSRRGRGGDPAPGGDERARDGRDAQGEGGQRGVAASDDGSYFGDDINHIN